MKAAAIAMLILLLPAVVLAGPTVAAYFTYAPNEMTIDTMPYEPITAYIYGQALGCYVNAFEFALVLPAGIIYQTITVPEGSLTLGDPIAGIAITYWPPLNGVDPGYNLLATIQLLTLPTGACCWNGGTLIDAPLRIVAHPATGVAFPRESCWPENNLVEVVGLTSTICPCQVGTENMSWGSIKSLF